jgi:hypothetical protein
MQATKSKILYLHSKLYLSTDELRMVEYKIIMLKLKIKLHLIRKKLYNLSFLLLLVFVFLRHGLTM